MSENNASPHVTRKELARLIRAAVKATDKGRIRSIVVQEMHAVREEFATRAEVRDIVDDKTRGLVKHSDFVRLETKFKFAAWLLTIVALAFGPALAAEVLEFWLHYFKDK